MRQERQRTTTKERMQEVLNDLGVSGSEFEKKCGLAHGFVSRVSSAINRETRAKIKSVYPDLNVDYITFGQGEIHESPDTVKDTIRDRIGQFVEYMNIKKREFTKKTGIADSFLTNMSGNIRKSSLERIYRAYPSLNPDWLEYGEGKMILDAPRERKTDSVQDRIKELIDFLGVTTTSFMAETEINSNSENVTYRTVNKIVNRFPFVNPQWLMHGIGEMYYKKPTAINENLNYAPLVSKKDYPIYPINTSNQDYINSLQKVPYMEEQETQGNVVAFEVFGDKMNDGTTNSYLDGDLILCRELSISSFCTMPLPFEHYDFVIVNQNGVHVRRIINHNVERACITLHCLNTFYIDEVVDLNNIKKLFVVVTKTSKKKR